MNASECSLESSASSYVESSNGELHYSYATCSAEDSFTAWYTERAGTINLCSVFSEVDARLGETMGDVASMARSRPCGNTHTHTQVEMMVGALNALNGGLGFQLVSGLVPRYYGFNYTWLTYPYGSWAAVGRPLSEKLFASDACDVVVGMANGCPDDEIVAQALVANATRRLYVTGRGPQSVRTRGAHNRSSPRDQRSACFSL